MQLFCNLNPRTRPGELMFSGHLYEPSSKYTELLQSRRTASFFAGIALLTHLTSCMLNAHAGDSNAYCCSCRHHGYDIYLTRVLALLNLTHQSASNFGTHVRVTTTASFASPPARIMFSGKRRNNRTSSNPLTPKQTGA